jgi:hypothetical protein
MEKPEKTNQAWVWLIYLLGALFVGSILWSMIFETLAPLWRAEATLEFWLNVTGMPIILAGVSVLVWGAWVFLRGTYGALGDEELVRNVAAIRAGEASGKQRWRNGQILFKAWRRGFLIMLAGFGLIALGGITINAIKVFGLG